MELKDIPFDAVLHAEYEYEFGYSISDRKGSKKDRRAAKIAQKSGFEAFSTWGLVFGSKVKKNSDCAGL